jgi:hypothetical protein
MGMHLQKDWTEVFIGLGPRVCQNTRTVRLLSETLESSAETSCMGDTPFTLAASALAMSLMPHVSPRKMSAGQHRNGGRSALQASG